MIISALSGLDYIRALFPAVLLSYSVILKKELFPFSYMSFSPICPCQARMQIVHELCSNWEYSSRFWCTSSANIVLMCKY